MHVRLIAPNFVTYNSTATLHCNHSVSDAELHKVEFMKDDKKILQYIKDRKPPFLESKVDGANMEVSLVQLTHPCLSIMQSLSNCAPTRRVRYPKQTMLLKLAVRPLFVTSFFFFFSFSSPLTSMKRSFRIFTFGTFICCI